MFFSDCIFFLKMYLGPWRIVIICVNYIYSRWVLHRTQTCCTLSLSPNICQWLLDYQWISILEIDNILLFLWNMRLNSDIYFWKILFFFLFSLAGEWRCSAQRTILIGNYSVGKQTYINMLAWQIWLQCLGKYICPFSTHSEPLKFISHKSLKASD